MKKYSKDVDSFLTTIILSKMNFSEYTDDNIGAIVEFMFSEIEGPLCDAEEAGDILSTEDITLLDIVSKAITEITTKDDWE